MVTIKNYLVPTEAELDRAALELEGIHAFVADVSTAALGYGTTLGGVRLQVPDEEVERAREILAAYKEAPPLSDDFVPPE